MSFAKLLLALIFALAGTGLAEDESDVKPAAEFPSPDGQFAFRYKNETETIGKTFELINRASGETLLRVAEGDLDPGPSARFEMEVLWRADSKAFALTATYWKRGSELSVYVREGQTFRELKLPELRAEITDKIAQGKSYPHVVELDAQRALSWRKDGALVAEIESMQDGSGSMLTALRSVTLSIPVTGPAKILSNTFKVTVENQ